MSRPLRLVDGKFQRAAFFDDSNEEARAVSPSDFQRFGRWASENRRVQFSGCPQYHEKKKKPNAKKKKRK